MTAPKYAGIATKFVRGATAECTPAEPSPERQDEMVLALQAALRERRRARVRRRGLMFGVLVAASAALVLLGVRASRTGAPTTAAVVASWTIQDPSAIVADVPTGIADNGRVSPGVRLRSGAEEDAKIDWNKETFVKLKPHGALRLVQEGKQNVFALEEGSVFAKVKKLTADERFLVRTADTEIEVRGTAFEVSVVPPDPMCGDGTSTRLAVTEGVVVVRRAGVEIQVAAGDTWPKCEPAAATPAPSPAAPSASSAPPMGVVASAAPPSALSLQNDRFAQAMSQKRAGDYAGAVVTFEALLRAHPSGPLAESATVERMRALGHVDQVRARQAAVDYLHRYPNGFAVPEAERIAAVAP